MYDKMFGGTDCNLYMNEDNFICSNYFAYYPNDKGLIEIPMDLKKGGNALSQKRPTTAVRMAELNENDGDPDDSDEETCKSNVTKTTSNPNGIEDHIDRPYKKEELQAEAQANPDLLKAPYEVKESDKANECAFGKDSGVCISASGVKKLAAFVKEELAGTKEVESSEVLALAKQKTGCNTQVCVLKNKEARRFIGNHSAEKELEENFKPKGPRESNEWFSNKHIDDVMFQWMKMFPNYLHISFQMIDFEKTGGSLARVSYKDMLMSKKNCLGCIINTDVSTGSGKHWMAVFVDLRSPVWTIEFFNSSGIYKDSSGRDKEKERVIFWMQRVKEELEALRPPEVEKVKYVCVAKIRHQRSETECGPYSVYYVWCRLNGISYKVFKYTSIHDAVMYEFRKMLFRPDH